MITTAGAFKNDTHHTIHGGRQVLGGRGWGGGARGLQRKLGATAEMRSTPDSKVSVGLDEGWGECGIGQNEYLNSTPV